MDPWDRGIGNRHLGEADVAVWIGISQAKETCSNVKIVAIPSAEEGLISINHI